MGKQPLIVIVGPTASGKSAFALELAKRFNGEIISADSRTIYKYLDIGTAKPSKTQQKQIPHHLLDVVEPSEKFSVADFKQLAEQAIIAISGRDKLPIMVGGSGLYVNSVLFDYDFRKPSTEETRDSFDKFTTEELQTMCSTIGIDVKSTNRRHLIRALETGQATELKEQQLRPDTLVIGIEAERQILQQRIVKRIGTMVKTGVMQEAEQLASKYGWDNEAMTGNVYEVIHQAQDQQWNQVKMIEEAIKRDLQLAKRQLTWFRRNPFIQWGEPGELITKVAQFVQKYKSK